MQFEEEKVDLNALLDGTDQAFKDKIFALKTAYSDEVEPNETCCICLDKFKATYTQLFVLGCDHILHKECCISWLKRGEAKMTCP